MNTIDSSSLLELSRAKLAASTFDFSNHSFEFLFQILFFICTGNNTVLGGRESSFISCGFASVLLVGGR